MYTSSITSCQRPSTKSGSKYQTCLENLYGIQNTLKQRQASSQQDPAYSRLLNRLGQLSTSRGRLSWARTQEELLLTRWSLLFTICTWTMDVWVISRFLIRLQATPWQNTKSSLCNQAEITDSRWTPRMQLDYKANTQRSNICSLVNFLQCLVNRCLYHKTT